MLPDPRRTESWSCPSSLNAPTGAWCSLTKIIAGAGDPALGSRCTYRCVVLPDIIKNLIIVVGTIVSMHLQVRGAP